MVYSSGSGLRRFLDAAPNEGGRVAGGGTGLLEPDSGELGWKNRAERSDGLARGDEGRGDEVKGPGEGRSMSISTSMASDATDAGLGGTIAVCCYKQRVNGPCKS